MSDVVVHSWKYGKTGLWLRASKRISYVYLTELCDYRAVHVLIVGQTFSLIG